MIAIGRASVVGALPQRPALKLEALASPPPPRTPQRDLWIARDVLWRRSCERLLVPVLHADGRRVYSSGTACGLVDVPAVPIEQDLLLKVLVRAAYALKRPGLVTPEERHRWHLVNPLDSHAMLVAGFVRVDVDDRGEWLPVWRHELEASG
ncbi:MAG: hypothetical protein ACRDTM_03775 [Micromonosporaceae bacterium]